MSAHSAGAYTATLLVMGVHPPPSPARANFTLIMNECTPESSGYYSVHSVVRIVTKSPKSYLYSLHLSDKSLIAIPWPNEQMSECLVGGRGRNQTRQNSFQPSTIISKLTINTYTRKRKNDVSKKLLIFRTMELDVTSLFGLLCTALLIGRDLG